MLNHLDWLPPYQLKRHARAKHINFRITDKPELIITMPQRFSERHLPALLEEHREWIIQKWRAVPAKKDYSLPPRLNLKAMHQIWTVQYCKTEQDPVLLERALQHELVILGNTEKQDRCFELLRKWLIRKARKFLPEKMQLVSNSTGLEYSRITVRNQKTRWGSCTQSKAINLNYKLILMPAELMEYVMIHELAHTVHMNHSKLFWNLVARHCYYWQDAVLAFKKIDQELPDWI